MSQKEGVKNKFVCPWMTFIYVVASGKASSLYDDPFILEIVLAETSFVQGRRHIGGHNPAWAKASIAFNSTYHQKQTANGMCLSLQSHSKHSFSHPASIFRALLTGIF